jgi:hypothetical protein
MTVEEVAAVAEAAGFACVEMLLTVVAIAVAESSLRPDAVNIHTEQGRRPDGTYHRDRGLWQISSYSFPQYSDAETFDPASAAAIVYELSAGGTDFSPWDSYTGGDVQRHIDGPYNGWPALRPIVEDYCGVAIVAAEDDAAVAGRAPPPTAEIIDGFMTRRAATIADAGPSLRHYLDRFNGAGSNGVSFSSLAPMSFAAIARGGGEAAFDAVAATPEGNWAIWAEGIVGQYRAGAPGVEVNGRGAMFNAGFDYLLGRRLIVGVTFAADAAREISDDLGYRIGGLGWMAGPYAAIRFGEGVILDAKLLWGRSRNSIQPLLSYTDQFTTSRRLATVRLSGEAVLGPVLLRPELALLYFEETQQQYVDTNGATIPEQTVRLGRVTFGPELAIPLTGAGGGLIEPSVGVYGLWDFTSGGLSARIEGGLRIANADGASLAIRGSYAGLFQPEFSAWRFSAILAVPLH